MYYVCTVNKAVAHWNSALFEAKRKINGLKMEEIAEGWKTEGHQD